MDYKTKEMIKREVLKKEVGAVFLSSIDGKLKSANLIAAKLLENKEDIHKLLPVDHMGLLRACLNTGLQLKRDVSFSGNTIKWSYKPSDKERYIYIYGEGFELPVTPAKCVGADNNKKETPMVVFSHEGELQSFNSHTSNLLLQLSIDRVEDVLPFNHIDLMSAAVNGKVPLTEARSIEGKTYVWTYEYNVELDEIKILCRDLTVKDINKKSESTVFRDFSGLVFTADVSGVTRFINYATYKLLDELNGGIDDILPRSHKGLIKACLATSTSLTEECKLMNRSIVWSYHPHDDGESVHVYGYEAE